MILLTPFELLAAFALDVIVGDPEKLPHPVRLIGNIIQRLELWLVEHIKNRRQAGVVLAATVVGGTWLSVHLICLIAKGISTPVGSIVMIYLAFASLALRGLMDSVRAVLVSIKDLDQARAKLGMIVGRDTSGLQREEILRAALESLAENASDGVIAPLFYLAIGGPALAFAYKAANTLDSMVGYKNDKYIELGHASASLDDLLNYIPARITGVLIVLAALLTGGLGLSSARRAWGVMVRDGSKHSSPNAGVPEAAIAGALGVRLGGPSVYFGQRVDKPYINDAQDDADNEHSGPVKAKHLKTALALIPLASVMGVMITAIVLAVRWSA